MVLLSSTAAFGQHFSYGAVAGTTLTDDFNSLYRPPPGGPLGMGELVKSDGKSVIVGPMLEWNFSPHFSLETDGLFRELHYQTAHAGNHYPTVTWEFPVLAKYRLFSYGTGSAAVRPFLEAGPSFRTTGNLNANPSHTGISAGAGLDFRLSHFDIAPTLRYTRWAENSPNELRARPDQIELLVAFSHCSGLDSHPFGKRLSLGVVLGTNLIGDYPSRSSTYVNAATGTKVAFSYRSGSRSFLVGPALEFRLADNFALEADAIYRPIRQYTSSSWIYHGQILPQSGESSFVTWQFPVLAKYALPIRLLGLRPFVEAGPSFRIGGSVTHYG
ncbi:MAG: hypothetical protein ACRD6B_17865 [Bryobacteraceae bacterium]